MGYYQPGKYLRSGSNESRKRIIKKAKEIQHQFPSATHEQCMRLAKKELMGYK